MTAPATTDKHRYFMMIPFMAADDLDIFEFRLLAHYTRICFLMGECLQGARAIQKATKISLGMITRTRKTLEAKGYICVSMPDGKSRNRGEAAAVTVVDRWQENTARYAKECSLHEQGCSPHEPACSPGEQSKELKDIDTQEQEKTTTAPVANSEQEPLEDVKAVVVFPGPAAQFSSTNENAASIKQPGPSAQSSPLEGAVSSTPNPVPVNPSPEPDSKPLPEQDNPMGRVLNLLENGIEGWGKLLGKTDTDNAQRALDEHPEDWVIDAIKEAKFRDKKFWGFVTGCLNNWKRDGYKSPTYNQTQQTGQKQRFVSRTHLQGSDLKPAQDYPDEMQFEPPPPKAETKGAIAAWS